MFSAGFKDASLLQFVSGDAPLRLALSRTFAASVHQLDKEIQTVVKRKFNFPGNPIHLRELSFSKSGKYGTGSRILSASLSYRYQAVPLSAYPMSLVSVPQSNDTAKEVQIKIRKRGSAKTVHGKSARYAKYQNGDPVPYMGFFQKGMIFERNQRKTWVGGERQPIHGLYAPSFTDLLRSPEVEIYLASSIPLAVIEDILLKEIVI